MDAPSRKFYVKIWVGFCLNTGKRFFLVVKADQKTIGFPKNGTRDFPNNPVF